MAIPIYSPRAKKFYFFHFKALLLKNYGNSFLTYVKDRFLCLVLFIQCLTNLAMHFLPIACLEKSTFNFCICLYVIQYIHVENLLRKNRQACCLENYYLITLLLNTFQVKSKGQYVLQCKIQRYMPTYMNPSMYYLGISLCSKILKMCKFQEVSQ